MTIGANPLTSDATKVGRIFITNSIPSLPTCDNQACNNKADDAQRKELRAMREQPAKVCSSAMAAEMGDDPQFTNAKTNGDIEMQQCSNCKTMTLCNTAKFKSCARCMRVRYWCVVPRVPPPSTRHPIRPISSAY
jgi:hypothetical protein